jgi:hypothetical protein
MTDLVEFRGWLERRSDEAKHFGAEMIDMRPLPARL